MYYYIYLDSYTIYYITYVYITSPNYGISIVWLGPINHVLGGRVMLLKAGPPTFFPYTTVLI